MKERVVEEMRKVIIITAYLYVCFAAVLLYRKAVLHAHGIEFALWGIAIVKALVLGKFVLIGRATHFGERYQHKPLIYYVLYQSLLFLVLLIAMSIAEEAIRGFFHGDSFIATITDMGGWFQIGAGSLLLWLVLLPYLGIIRLREVIGPDRLHEIVWGEGRMSS